MRVWIAAISPGLFIAVIVTKIIISLGIALAAVIADRSAAVSTILLRFYPLACSPAQHSADHRVRLLIAQNTRTLPVARVKLVLQDRKPIGAATLANASQTIHIPIQAGYLIG